MAAVAPAMQTIQLQVPPDGQPGQLIQAQVNGQTVQAQIPAGLQPGATFAVQIPAATQQANDAAALAAYDALLAGASRLLFSSKYGHGGNGPYDKGPWSVETDTGAAFQVTFDAPSKRNVRGDGSYQAEVKMGDVVVQQLKSTGVAIGNGTAAYYRCPHPPASQSMDRGEALTIQLEPGWKSKFYGAFVLNRRVDGVQMTHWLISTQVGAADRMREVPKVHLLQLAGGVRAIDARRRRWPHARGAPFR